MDIFGILLSIVLLAILGLFVYGVCAFIKKFIEKTGDTGQSLTGQGFKLAQDTMLSRVLICLILILASLIPLNFVRSLVLERERLYNEVADRMVGEWSGAQSISGPILTIPYEYTQKVSKRVENPKTGNVLLVDRPEKVTRYLTILPEDLTVKSTLKTEELKRGIYKVPIYTSTNSMEGVFKWPDLTVLDHAPERFIWDKAIVSILVSETKGIQAGSTAIWGGASVAFEPGNGFLNASITQQGLHTRLRLDETFKTNPSTFGFDFDLRGSRGIMFSPTGKEATISLSGDWGDPSFKGALLPVKREITHDSFSANWNVSYLSRSFSQVGSHSLAEVGPFLDGINSFNVGADLFNTVNLYTLLDRTIKYGVMFVSLTFFSIFIVEFASGARLHWLQHLIIGAALSMFYLCVLAFSEHIPFGYGYTIGMMLITAVITVYAWIAMGRLHYGLTLGGVMIALYSVFYSILQMEDYALLIGTMLLLTFLILGMYVTRNIGKRAST